jgi:hypothetical protein
VTRGDTRQIAALIAAVLALGLLLAACGDSDSDSTTSPTQTSITAEGDGSSARSDSSADGSKPQDSDASGASSEASGASQKSGGSGDAPVSTPLKVSGGGSEQFRFKGGDNSIQEYGEESDEAELQEAAEAVHGFYVARAEEDWGKACSYLAESMVSQLEALAGQSPELKGKDCAPVLKAFTRPLPASVRRETTVVNAGSFRHDDERGFLIYYDVEDKAYAIPLEDEDGTWKLTLLSATPLG